MKIFHVILTTSLLVTCAAAILIGCTPEPQYYTNPIDSSISMGDPFVVKYDDKYYLTGTTAANEGFHMWSSDNMIDWTPLGLAYKAPENAWGKSNYWAPELFRRGDKYYLTYSVDSQSAEVDFRLCLAESDKPEGPYKDIYTPWCDFGVSAIDAHVFVDDDDSVYLYYAKVGTTNEPKFKLLGDLYGVKLKSDLSGPETEPTLISKPTQPWELPDEGKSLCNEGAFVFREKDKYFITYSANSYDEPFYGIGYSTADSPLGPWTKAPDNPLLENDKALGVSGPGHCSITTSPDGKERFIVYHSHIDPKKPEGPRTVNIDRLTVTEDGKLKVEGPTRTQQLIPSGARLKGSD